MELFKESSFFAFMRERENIRRRKASGAPHPLTMDPILSEYKFTNVQRFHDWTSKMLREHFYTPNFYADKRSILMNAAFVRYFGRFEFIQHIGWQPFDNFDLLHIADQAAEWKADGKKVFTGAYVITNQGIKAPKEEVVCNIFLAGLLEQIDYICQIAETSDSWEAVAEEMMKIKGYGGSGFMTKEILLDTTYCHFWKDVHSSISGGRFSLPADYDSWTPIGPGGRRGATRVLGSDLEDKRVISEELARKVIMQLHDAADGEFEFFPLCPHDIQFQLCEFDKYERVRLGQGRPRSKYKPRSVS